MTATFWLPPLVRALATALLVVSASAVAESLGPFWGALIASLPVSAGPAYVFLAMQHGADFVAASALSSFAANAATGLFLIAYGVLAGSTPPWRALGAAVAVWLAASLATQQVAWTPSMALILNLAVYGVGFALLDAVPGTGPKPTAPEPRRHDDVGAVRASPFTTPGIIVRAVAVAAFVSLLVAVSSMLGAAVTGIAAVFPISLISLIVIVRPRIGGSAASLLAANALRSMLGFGMMLLSLHLAIRPCGTATAFVIALLVSVCWSAGLLLLRRRGAKDRRCQPRAMDSGRAMQRSDAN